MEELFNIYLLQIIVFVTVTDRKIESSYTRFYLVQMALKTKKRYSSLCLSLIPASAVFNKRVQGLLILILI